MKSVVQGNITMEYESALGDSFLLMDDWAHTNLSEAEMLVYANDEYTEEKKALFDRWLADQQITSLRMYVDGVLHEG